MRRNLLYLVCFIGLLALLTACSSNPKQPNTPQANTPQASSATFTVGEPTAAPGIPTSNQLISTALQSGVINEETALKYQVFAIFNDPRLPAQYQSVATVSNDSHILDEVQAEFVSLTPETQQEMIPFLMPPAYKGSWADPNQGDSSSEQKAENASRYAKYGLPCKDLNPDWEYKSAMHSPVRFWWSKYFPADEQAANSLIVAMDDQIWPKLTTLMGHTPKPDGGTPCNGGSTDFDVYLTPLIRRSVAPSDAPPGCRDTPSFIVLNSSVKNDILAHEFMHAIQWSYPTANGCMYPGDYAWLAEATATWAQDYIYPSENDEHYVVQFFYNPTMAEPTLPLFEKEAGYHQYGAYLFFFYLTHHFGQPEIVSRAWANTTANGSEDAVDLAIPGGLKDIWGDFAIRNYIEPPEDDYQMWDNLNIKPSGKSLDEIQVSSTGEWTLPIRIEPLSIKYEKFTFDEDARLVTFLNGYAFGMNEESMENDMLGVIPIKDGTTKYKFTPRQDVDDLKIQAYFKIAGDTDWQLEDWTDKETMSFCRDASDERVTDLVIVISNSSKDDRFEVQGMYAPTFEASDVGCWRYSGTASLEMTGSGSGGQFSDNQDVTDVTFERTDSHPNIPYPFLRFQVVGGQDSRTYQFSNENCMGIADTTYQLGARNRYELYILYSAMGPSVKRYGGTSNANQSITVNFQCKDSKPTATIDSFPWFYTDVLSRYLNKVYTVSSGAIIDGADNMLEEAGNATMKYKWHLEPFRDEGGSGDSFGDGSSGIILGQQGIIGGGGGSATPPAGGGTASPMVTPPYGGLEGIPIYPNIYETQQIQSGIVVLTTFDPKSQVAEFYKKEFVREGWTDSSMPYDASMESIQLVFSKDKRIVMIMISAKNSKTSIMISSYGG